MKCQWKTSQPAKEGNYYVQWMVAILANMTLLTYGLQSGWISPMTKVLQADVSPLDSPLSDSEISWIASLMCLAAVFGVSMYAYIADAYGRRVGIVAIAIPQALCWILKLTTTSTTGLIIARICCGIPAGGCFNIIPMYIKEISQDNIRGLLGSLLILMQNVGILAMYAMGSYLDYHTVLWIVLGIPIVTAMLMLKAPESPAYLVKIGKTDEAARTIAFLRGLEVNDKSVLNEISDMNNDDFYYKTLPKISFVTILNKKPWRKTLLLSTALITVGASNGSYAIITYASAILDSSGVTISPELQALSFPAVMILASFGSICCVEKVGRRVIISTCYMVTVISLFSLASAQLAQYQGIRTPGWLPVLSIVMSLCAYSAGVAPMPYIMMSEMFNFQIRAKAMGFIVTYAWLVSFVQLSLYAWTSATFGTHVTFYGFAAVNLLGIIVAWYLPETRVSLQGAFLGFTNVWPSYTLKVLEGPASPLGFSISKSESNLVGSIPMIGSLIATPMAGFVCDKLGRKRTQIVARLIVVLAWCLNLTAKSAIQLLIGRFLDGFGCGIASVVTFVFMVEITQLSVRGNATALVALLYNIGILISYVLGWFCSYEFICYFAITGCVLLTMIFCWLKETPVNLLRHGHEKEALASLKFFRGDSKTTDEILEEFSYMKSLGENNKESTVLEKSNDPEKEMLKVENGFVDQAKEENPWKLLWIVDHNRRALFFYVAYMVLSISMGMIAVQTYAEQFLTQAVPSLSPDLCAVLLAVVFIGACCVMVVITNMLPRRFMTISTGIIATICLSVLGSLLKWSWGPNWLPLLCVIIYVVAFQIGIVNILLVQLSESFGPDVNSTASAIVLCAMFISNFVVLTLFLPAVKYLGMAGTFFIFAGISFINTVVCIFCQKETRYVPLEKVQSMFAQGYLYRKS